MTPGQYLYLQRRAAQLSRHDLALRIDTDPPICAREREKLLVSIEANLVLMSASDAQVLATIQELRIDLPRLLDLIEAPAIVSGRPLLIAVAPEARP